MSAVATASLLPEPAPRRNDEERRLHESAMVYLDWALPADAIAHHSPGEGKRSKGAQIALRRSGYKAGWPDIEVIYRGRVYFIELKSRHGSLSHAQRAMLNKLHYCDAPVACCKSLPEVEAALREMCVPLRGSVAV